MKIGFIGFGEAGSNIAEGLGEDGLTGLRASDIARTDLVISRAEKTGVDLIHDNAALAEWADLIIVAVPTQNTNDVVDSVIDHLRPGQIYADITSSSSKAKQLMAERVEKTGALFADVALLGFVPGDKHRVPAAASGSGAGQFIAEMSRWGMNIEYLEGPVGAACAIKLTRSIFMKGIAALLYETLQCADAYGVTDEVVKSLAYTMNKEPFEDALKRLVCSTAVHAERRGHEMEGSIVMLEEAGISSVMTRGTMQRHFDLLPYGFKALYGGKNPPTWEEVIEAIRPRER